nr:MAG TPA: hypothetical protein [Caudoviricetes sp.]
MLFFNGKLLFTVYILHHTVGKINSFPTESVIL